jgi:hypothetical protein
MKRAIISPITVIASLALLKVAASAQPVTSQLEHPAVQVPPSSGQAGGIPGMGMMGQGKMGGAPMMGPLMMRGPGGMMQSSMMPCSMMDMPMMQMMMNDPKTRAQMMQIHGRMMKEMGELMEKRGKELEQAK